MNESLRELRLGFEKSKQQIRLERLLLEGQILRRQAEEWKARARERARAQEAGE